MATPFWSNNPAVLFNKKQVTDLWPKENMGIEEKLNAITRTVIVLTILGYLLTRNPNMLVIGVLTIVIIFVLYRMRKNGIIASLSEPKPVEEIQEGFKNLNKLDATQVNITNKEDLKRVLKEEYYNINKKNPLGNVLLTEIHDKPDRKSAPPSFNPMVKDNINSSVKRAVQALNPDIHSTNKELFSDMSDRFDFDCSMRNFYTTANSQVLDGQNSLAQWCYGNMPSSKEGNEIALLKNNQRYNLT